MTQIYPIWDDDSNDERMAISASFADSCLVILRDDSTLLFLQSDESGDLDEVILHEQLAEKSWISCSLYYDKTGTFSSVKPTSKGQLDSDLYLFLLDQDYRLYVSAPCEFDLLELGSLMKVPSCLRGAQIYRFPDQTLVTTIEGVAGLPPILSSEAPRRFGTRESLAEAIVADLGDRASAFPYLIVRSTLCCTLLSLPC